MGRVRNKLMVVKCGGLRKCSAQGVCDRAEGKGGSRGGLLIQRYERGKHFIRELRSRAESNSLNTRNLWATLNLVARLVIGRTGCYLHQHPCLAAPFSSVTRPYIRHLPIPLATTTTSTTGPLSRPRICSYTSGMAEEPRPTLCSAPPKQTLTSSYRQRASLQNIVLASPSYSVRNGSAYPQVVASTRCFYSTKNPRACHEKMAHGHATT